MKKPSLAFTLFANKKWILNFKTNKSYDEVNFFAQFIFSCSWTITGWLMGICLYFIKLQSSFVAAQSSLQLHCCSRVLGRAGPDSSLPFLCSLALFTFHYGLAWRTVSCQSVTVAVSDRATRLYWTHSSQLQPSYYPPGSWIVDLHHFIS